jgi:hypothetical protein
MALIVKTPQELAIAHVEGRILHIMYSGAGTVIYAAVVNRSVVVHTTEAWSVTL